MCLACQEVSSTFDIELNEWNLVKSKLDFNPEKKLSRDEPLFLGAALCKSIACFVEKGHKLVET